MSEPRDMPEKVRELYEEKDLYEAILRDEFASLLQKRSARRELALVEQALANREA